MLDFLKPFLYHRVWFSLNKEQRYFRLLRNLNRSILFPHEQYNIYRISVQLIPLQAQWHVNQVLPLWWIQPNEQIGKQDENRMMAILFMFKPNLVEKVQSFWIFPLPYVFKRLYEGVGYIPSRAVPSPANQGNLITPCTPTNSSKCYKSMFENYEMNFWSGSPYALFIEF